MAKIEAILKISDDDVNGEIDTASSITKSNNISSYAYTYDILPFINSMGEGNRAFGGAIVKTIGTTPTFSQLRFGAISSDGARVEKYKGLLLGNSDSSKNYTLTLTLTGVDIIGIEIYFDSYTNQYPTQYTYTHTRLVEPVVETGNTSNKIKISGMPSDSATFTISFTKWNLANTPIGITFIDFPTEEIKLTKAQIVSFDSQAQIISSTSGINYGLIATTGKIEMNDKDGWFYNKAKLGYLNAYLFTLDLRVNSKSIQTHVSTNSPLYTSDRMLTLDLSDILTLWDNIVVGTNDFNSGDSLYDVVTFLATKFPSLDVATMCNNYCVVGNENFTSYRSEETIALYLQGITFTRTTTLNEGTLREQFEKVCTCAQLCICITRDNKIKFVSARPNYMFENQGKEIKIPYSKQISRPDYDILVANRYEDVDFR